MHDIHLVLQRLNDYFKATQPVEQLQEQVSQVQNVDYDVLINNLTEICTESRQTRESNVFDNTHDSWEYFSRIISIKHLVAYFTGLLALGQKDATNFLYQKLSVTVCRTYILLLTSPGAKIYDAFEPPLMQKIFKIFGLLKLLGPFKEHQRIQLQMAIIMLLEDLVLYLKHVSFVDYEDLQLELVEAIAGVMEYHHEHGFSNKYSSQIQEQCYAVLEHVCLPLHGHDISTSLSLVLNGTACLHKFTRPCGGSSSNAIKSKYNMISDWFLEMLKHYPRQMSTTLKNYIKAVLSDAELMSNKELQPKYLDNCAQYDAAMVRVCGESMADYVEQVSYSKDSQHRLNCIELITRMLIIDAECNWELFRHELSTIPREIKLIRILLQKVYDQNNVVSLKGVNAFLRITNDGNKRCKEIIQKCFMNTPAPSTEIPPEPEPEPEPSPNMSPTDESDDSDDEFNDTPRSPKAKRRRNEPKDYTLSDDYNKLAAEIRQNTLRATQLQFKNSSALIRKVILLFLEFLGKTKLDISPLIQSWDFRQLYVDQSPLVRRQLVIGLDHLMNIQPSNERITMAWVKVILDMANDTDQKVMETVIDSFKANIFDKIQNYENSPLLKHVFPWRLLKVMLESKDSPDFRISMQKWMNKDLLSAKTLAKIETHLDTNNATEAWILLAMVAANIKGHNPERVSKLLLQNLKYDMANSVEGCYIQLEVLAYWMKYLNNPSKNEIKRLMTEMLELGSIKPRNINRAFGICYKLSCKSGTREKQNFVNCMQNASEDYVLKNKNSLFVPNLVDNRLLSYLYLYSEVASILEYNINHDIADLAFEFLIKATESQKAGNQADRMLPRKLNCIQSILTGFSSFNLDVCGRFVSLLGKMLREIDQAEACITAIKCLGYLCRKNTAVVENVVPHILSKTQHKYASIREYSLNMLATLILEDYLKLRGSLLIYILASMLDASREIRELSMELVLKYTLEKNDAFMRTCLLECPFIFNGCQCFGQCSTNRSHSENILRGNSKRINRETIYRFLIKKIDANHLYMYLGNMSRLNEYIEKSGTLKKSIDEQAAVIDFLFICTDICIANAKHKRAVDKIIKDTQNGEQSTNIDDHEQEMMDAAEAEEAAQAGVNMGATRATRGGRKNQMTMAQALAAVEKAIPHIVQTVETLNKINGKLFKPITDKMCMEMCGHFEAMFEYAPPRKFWAKYIDMARKSVAVSATPATKKSTASTSKNAEKETNAADSGREVAGTSSTANDDTVGDDKNDSGQFTMEDGDQRDRTVDSSSKALPSPTGASSSQTAASSRNRLEPFERKSISGRKTTPLGRRSPFDHQPPASSASRPTRATGNSRRRIIDTDSDDDSVISNKSSVSNLSRATGYSVKSNYTASTTSRKARPEFQRKKR